MPRRRGSGEIARRPRTRAERILDWLIRRACFLRCLFWSPPRYEGSAGWVGHGSIRMNNCYNYACNIRTDTFATPGRASGYTLPIPYTCEEVSDAAISDGLTVSNYEEPCPHCSHKVALAVNALGVDYHWYRQDSNGMWSHKGGMGGADNLDHSGNPISDPRTADRGAYTEFCGFFCVHKCRVRIE